MIHFIIVALMLERLTPLVVFFEQYGLWIAAASFVIFVVSVASIPYIIAAIPVDYFHYQHRQSRQGHSQHPLIRLSVVSLKNLLGALLVCVGVVMLFTPGQGLLSILFGLMIMNYPGKYRLECWIIKRPLVLNAINKLRDRHGKLPLLPPL